MSRISNVDDQFATFRCDYIIKSFKKEGWDIGPLLTWRDAKWYNLKNCTKKIHRANKGKKDKYNHHHIKLFLHDDDGLPKIVYNAAPSHHTGGGWNKHTETNKTPKRFSNIPTDLAAIDRLIEDIVNEVDSYDDDKHDRY